MRDSLEKLASAWIALNNRSTPPDLNIDDPNQWAHDRLWTMCQNDPDQAWAAILYIVERVPNDYVLGNLAAGPLENLLGCHGEEMIDRVERKAAANPAFKKMLSGVWKNDISETVWRRIEIARETLPRP